MDKAVIKKKTGSILFALILGINPELTRLPSAFAPDANNKLLIPDLIQSYNKESILSDNLNRISDDFKIQPEFKDRVSFWFDIYTKYSATEEVIHHTEYPWVVFRVVDLNSILSAPGNRWVKYHKAQKHSKKQVKDVRNILKKLSKLKNYKNLSEDEKVILDALSVIPGKNRKKVILEASRSVRVQVGQKEYVEKGLTSSTLYMPELEKIFSDKNLPLELTRLPFVESSFNVDAVSKVGASGIWQVMPYIGKKFLTINPAVDERNSPIKSAKTAAFILHQNYKILKKWPLALTAYNHGTGSLLKGIKKTKSNDLSVLIKKYHAKSFGFASQNFYASFLAILHAEKYQEKIFPKIERLSPIQYRELKLTKSIRVNKLMSLLEVESSNFKNYNLDIKSIAYKKNHLLPKGYVVHIPESHVETFLEKHKDQVFAKLLEPASNKESRL